MTPAELLRLALDEPDRLERALELVERAQGILDPDADLPTAEEVRGILAPYANNEPDPAAPTPAAEPDGGVSSPPCPASPSGEIAEMPEFLKRRKDA